MNISLRGLAETLAAHRSSLGISRVGDLTGLDTIGIPVWFACRPNSRCLSVAQGKGLSHEQARISATMEAAEHAYAERTDELITMVDTPDQLRRGQKRVISLDKTMRCVTPQFDQSSKRSWVEGFSLMTDEPVLAPYELVGMDMRVDSPWDHETFRMSSVGLGAGLTVEAAALHALLELIENDATALLDGIGPHHAFMNRCVHVAGINASLDTVIARVLDSGLDVTFAHIPTTIRTPVVGAFIHAPETAGPRSATPVYGGYACRLDAADAALAALLEAAQSRLTDIAASRDDIDPADYSPGGLKLIGRLGKPVTLAELCRNSPSAHQSAGVALHHVIAACATAGISDVQLFPLGGEDIGISVVRVLASGLEAAADDGHIRLGERGLEALIRAAKVLQ